MTKTTAPAETSDPAGDVARAETEATEAAALAAALEERVRNGDDTVTADEVDNARKLSGFARLRKDAAERKAAAAKADMIATARREHAEEIITATRSGALDVAPVATAYARMCKAVAGFVKAANTYNQAWADAENGTRNYPYRYEDGGPTMADLGIRMVTTVVGHPQVEADGVRRYRLRAGEHIARAVVEAEAGISPHYGMPLHRPLGGAANAATQYQPDLVNGTATGKAATR